MKLKFLLLFTFSLLCLSTHLAFGQTFDEGFKELIDNHQSTSGFDYIAVSSEEIENLNSILSSEFKDNFITSKASIATKINVYNFLVIKQILAAYPISSVAEINNFFTQNLELGGSPLSLDALEKHIIKAGKNPYLHFLLNCGAKGCPRLQFISPEVDIDAYISEALKDKHIIDNYGSKTYLSQIFFWNQEEFGEEKKIIEQLNKFANLEIKADLPISYLEYNWLLNDKTTLANNQTFYPTKLYSKGRGELKIFNNYYTQNENNFRANFFSSFFQLLLGTNKNLNFGLDIKFRSVTQGKVSTFSALGFKNRSFYGADSTQSFARIGISGIGPRIKYQPFKAHNNINILHSLYFVPMDEAQGNGQYGYSDYNYMQLYNQIFYEKEYSVKRRLFIDFGLHIENIRLNKDTRDHFMPIQLPITVIYSYFPDSKMTLYGLGSFGQRLDLVFPSDSKSYTNYTVYGQLGAGIKYYLTDFLEGELLYTNFLDTTPGRTAHTFNVGLRFFRF